VVIERAGAGLALGGIVAAAALLAFVALVGGGVWRAWLAAAVLCASIPTGALTLSMMTRLIPGSWREGLAAPLAIAPGLLPLAILAMAPVLLAPGQIYTWAHHPQEGAFRAFYLAPPFFALRGMAWFAGLIVLALRLRPGREATVTSAIGLLVLVPASLAITTDWLMSLDRHFASSGYGLYVLSLQICLALALAVAAAVASGPAERVRDVLGGVLFCALALWAYLGFMQYFIIWSDDLPSTVAWYLRRGGAWSTLAWGAIVLKGVPLALLTVGHVRRAPRVLVTIALSVAVGSALEMGWLTLPAPGPAAGALDLFIFGASTAALAVAALGVWVLARARRGAAP